MRRTLEFLLNSLIIQYNNSNNDKVIIKRGNFVCQRAYDGIIFHGARIDIKKEVLIRTVNKDWGYLEKDSLIEKRRLKENLKDIILYYAGINLLCLGQFEESLKTLKVLYHNDGQPRIVKSVNGEGETVVLPKSWTD